MHLTRRTPSARRPRAVLALAAVLTMLTLLATLVPLATPAHASADDDTIRRLDVQMDVADSGQVFVTETYEWDFGTRQGRGFARDLRVRFAHGEGTEREYRYSDFSASSPSGAPADVRVLDHGATLSVQVAAPEDSDVRVTGMQTYVLEYTITGALNAVRDQAGVPDADELYWNMSGDSHPHIADMTASVTGPVDVTAARCAQRGGDDCDSLSTQGSGTTATGSDIDEGTNLTLAVAFPPGTFTDTAPILVAATDDGEERANLLAGAATAGIVAVAVGWFAVSRARTRRARRDLAFVGVTPGVIPPDAATHPVEQVTSEPTVAVRFTPPDGLSPGEAGALRTKDLRSRYVTATLVDLAVRGYLQIVEVPHGRRSDWSLVPLTPPADAPALRHHEQLLLGVVFAGSWQPVLLSTLRNRFATPATDVSTAIGQSLRAWGLVNQSLGNQSAGSQAYRQRSAVGRALYEQTRGFELYLGTAEADQLRFEEGQDLFSRYLPWAITLDLADRWARIFADLQRMGVPVQEPTWYVSPSPTFLYLSFAHSMSSFTTSASTTIASSPAAAATTSSSGGSGFSGSSSTFSGGGGGGGGSHGL